MEKSGGNGGCIKDVFTNTTNNKMHYVYTMTITITRIFARIFTKAAVAQQIIMEITYLIEYYNFLQTYIPSNN